MLYHTIHSTYICTWCIQILYSRRCSNLQPRDME